MVRIRLQVSVSVSSLQRLLLKGAEHRVVESGIFAGPLYLQSHLRPDSPTLRRGRAAPDLKRRVQKISLRGARRSIPAVVQGAYRQVPQMSEASGLPGTRRPL